MSLKEKLNSLQMLPKQFPGLTAYGPSREIYIDVGLSAERRNKSLSIAKIRGNVRISMIAQHDIPAGNFILNIGPNCLLKS